jgi:glycosyltransferase involved in cell wall biosynthesis
VRKDKKEKPLVSIITVCYNSGKYISDTIESVLNQTYDNIEYIIVDGKSTDNTLDIIKEYEPKFNGRMKWISESDEGIYDAMNKGIQLSNGSLIGILNSDDWYELDTVQIAIGEYNNNSQSVIYGILRMFKDGKVFMLKQHTHYFLKDYVVQHPTCFIPKQIYDKFGLYNDNYEISADFELLNRYKKNEVNFVRVEKVMTNFRMGGASESFVGLIESLKIKHKYGYISKTKKNIKISILKSKLIINKLISFLGWKNEKNFCI